MQKQQTIGARGMMLLEVVLALSILLLAMAMIGASVRNSDANAHRAVDTARALLLAEQVITYYDTGQFQDQREVSRKFGAEGPPGWAYEFKLVKDANVEGLERASVRIINGDPEGNEEENTPVFVAHFLRAEKKNLNMQEDLGMSEAQVTQLTDAIPGGAALLDPTNFDPTSLARLDMNTLQELLPVLMQQMPALAASGGMGGLSALGGGAAGGLPSSVQQAMQQGMNQGNRGQPNGGQGGGRGQGNNGFGRNPNGGQNGDNGGRPPRGDGSNGPRPDGGRRGGFDNGNNNGDNNANGGGRRGGFDNGGRPGGGRNGGDGARPGGGRNGGNGGNSGFQNNGGRPGGRNGGGRAGTGNRGDVGGPNDPNAPKEQTGGGK